MSSQGLTQVLRAEEGGTEGETPPRCLGGRSAKSHRRRWRFSPKTGPFARAQVSQSVRLIEPKTLIPMVRLLGTFFCRILSGKVVESSTAVMRGRTAAGDGRSRSVTVGGVTVVTVKKVAVLREPAVNFHDQRSRRKSISRAFLW